MAASSYEQLPADLPVPEDDGAAAHLPGTVMSAVTLPSTTGGAVSLAALGEPRAGARGTVSPGPHLAILYVYPMTGTPGVPLIEGWDQIPGARGCTPESCGFRDHYGDLAGLGAEVFGMSSQSTAEQAEAAARLMLPFPLLSDPGLVLADRLALPTFTASDGVVRYKRLTLVVRNGHIEHVFYPVFPPDRHAEEVLAWVRAQAPDPS
jgi:peroxiredoxin